MLMNLFDETKKWLILAGACIVILFLGLLIYTSSDIVTLTNRLQFPTQLNVENEYKKPKTGLSGKEGATDIPSWARGEKPFVGESGQEFARRLLDHKYGPRNYPTGPRSEFNRLRKYADRHFE